MLSGSMRSAWGQQNQHRGLLSALSEGPSVGCESQSGPESAMRRPAWWPRAAFHTCASCDWIKAWEPLKLISMRRSSCNHGEPADGWRTARRFSCRIVCNFKCKYCGASAQQLRRHVQSFHNFTVRCLVGLPLESATMQSVGKVWTRGQAHRVQFQWTYWNFVEESL